jgi:hypothetical protein
LLVIEPEAVRLGAVPAHDDTDCTDGCTEADTAISLLAALQSSL